MNQVQQKATPFPAIVFRLTYVDGRKFRGMCMSKVPFDLADWVRTQFDLDPWGTADGGIAGFELTHLERVLQSWFDALASWEQVGDDMGELARKSLLENRTIVHLSQWSMIAGLALDEGHCKLLDAPFSNAKGHGLLVQASKINKDRKIDVVIDIPTRLALAERFGKEIVNEN